MNPILIKSPTTDPFQILRYRDRQYAAELIAVALLHYDLFSWLDSEQAVTTERILKHYGICERPTDVLLTLCRANGFLKTCIGGTHTLTQLAREHLVVGSPWYLGPYYEPIRDTPITAAFLKVLETDKPANWQAKEDGNDWHQSMLSDSFAQSFTDLMNCRGLACGQMLAKALTGTLGGYSKILDIGGGSGIYSSALVATHPELSAVVLEQSPVDRIVSKEIARHGLCDRVSVVTGNMFEDTWPEGADVVLLSNVLHDWGIVEVKRLLEKTSAYLPSGGLIIIHGAFINEDKTGPLPVAEYSALLMNITQGKCYSTAEYASELADLGFEVGPYRDTVADRGLMTAMKL